VQRQVPGLGVGLTGGQDLAGPGGQVERLGCVQAGLAQRKGQQRVDELLLGAGGQGRSCAVRSVSMVTAGSARATWLMTRWRASGVRSSWVALAMNWRWARMAACSRASSPSKVSPSSLS
jgi:hypothetical protein